MPGAHYWTRNENLLLIESYRKFEAQYANSKLTQDLLWRKVAEEIMFIDPGIFSDDRKVVAKLCGLQMAILIKKYKEILKVNEKSGNGKADWEYFEFLHEIYHKKPWVEPLSVAGSSVPFKGLISRDQKKKRNSVKKLSEFESKKIHMMKMRLEMQEREREESNAHEKEKVSLLKDVIRLLK